MTAPGYICPPGIPCPTHVRHPAPTVILDGAGPDGVGGMSYGRTYHRDAAPLYHKTSAGWYVCLHGTSPRDLLRTASLPSLHAVAGWQVPHILRDAESLQPMVGYWTGEGFHVPGHLAPIVDRLREVVDYAGPVEHAHARLAADLLALNYHVSIYELGLIGALTNPDVWRIIEASVGIRPGSSRG